MADIIDLVPKLPKPDAALVETLRTMLSDAQNGRMTSLLALYVTEGNIISVFHYASAIEKVGLESFFDMMRVVEDTE